MAKTWQTVTDACQTLGISQRTLYRRIKKGAIESKVEGNRRLVLVDMPDGLPEADNGRQVADTALLEQIQTENEHLKQQLEQRDQQIEYLKEQIQEKDKQIERQQMIVMQLSRDIESQQKMLEDQTRRKGVSFWRRRVFGRRGASERE